MKIGSRQVVHTATLIMAKGDDAWLTFNVDAWKVEIQLRFKVDNEEDHGNIKIDIVDEKPLVTFYNWSNSLGTATTSPVPFGTTNKGQKLTFMATHWPIGNAGQVNKLDLQFLLEEAE